MSLPTFPQHRSAGLGWTLAPGHDVRTRENSRTLLLMAFGTVLWLANWFPLQSSDYLCTATAVVSKERWRELLTLSRTSEIDSSRILWIAYQNQHQAHDTVEVERPMQPSLRVVKLRIGLDNPSSPPEIDRELDRLTRVDRVASRSVVDRQLNKDRWRLQVAEHALTRFRLDREREGVAVGDVTVGDIETSTPFRLASQSTAPTSHLSPLDRSTLDSLRLEIESARQAVASKEKGLQQSDAQSAGYIALTGAPRLSALPGKFSWSHLGILAAFGLSILAGSQRWSYGYIPAMESVKRWLQKRRSRGLRSEGAGLDLSHRWEADLARSMQRLGIAYWGAIQTTSPLPALPPATRILPATMDDPGAVAPARNKFPSKSRLARCANIADAILAAWVIAFLLRYALDMVWRELLFRAPLAALSSVVFGI